MTMAQIKTYVKLLLHCCCKEKMSRGRNPVIGTWSGLNYRPGYSLKLHCIKLVMLQLKSLLRCVWLSLWCSFLASVTLRNHIHEKYTSFGLFAEQLTYSSDWTFLQSSTCVCIWTVPPVFFNSGTKIWKCLICWCITRHIYIYIRGLRCNIYCLIKVLG